ncbi:type I-U CRISPR-associated protein Cas7 [Natronosporangium hydrolyticum]|uniref:Type I-U CRISPR-associated protein Cas7 n=1 Tax=Natronosporangium hydrolyticum TaxID=2811111 RepID=A0A895YG14_9ACTN|nr:type I-U CRISPR-associated RAMP protein Csb1/Cas7u [Natronosporangium hydrolyticum]QSB16757.1 type I-U CRISPR-associated protein Cas7 [Natronosporangium hydrolyticum]
MRSLDLATLLAAGSPGGSSCLTSTTALEPAGGRHSSVAPAKFADRAKKGGVYAYEQRYLGDESRYAVVIDSKQSQLNRAEVALAQAVEDGHPLLSRVPHVRVSYERDGAAEHYYDLTLPHRVYDGHIRAGSIDGQPATQTPAYRAVRDASPANARALLETSPVTLIFGGWDSSRRSRQGRWRSALVGEIVGFVSASRDHSGALQKPEAGLRGGARVDPVGMQINLNKKVMTEVANQQQAELSPTTHGEILKAANGIKAGEAKSASALGLGGIPPSLDQLAGVACDAILRTHVLSFATLRQMRFGAGVEGDAACRALLAALALNALARADAELFLRANCDLVEAEAPKVRLDQRGGAFADLEPLSIDAADLLLSEALAHAEKVADVTWSGLAMRVTGNPDIVSGAVEADEAAP